MNTKTCSDCKEEKDLSQFYSGHAWRTLKYGHDRLCKSCRNGYNLKMSRTQGSKSCTVDDCDKRHYAKGYCRVHYDRVRLTGQTDSMLEIIGANQEKKVYRNVNGKQVYSYSYSLKSRLKYKYNLTVEQWNDLSKDGCNVCGSKQELDTDRNLHVDHDHACCPGKSSCGKCVRGAVCNKCNTAIGRYEKNTLREDYPNRKKIIAYLVNYDIRRKKEEAN